ncbi:hypothetical protein [Clostridium pasteurianum]|uniref:Uncharacterized protein n=1 Tax=Clostridium pasteurianum BC1 TaxID=86416 RepID=R4K3J5_CLOPA|nr:hypothetical protein [Clostridium pasteurianum]AGK97702.1 hypothetical protein Clopa_2864 [Clostridium pasteurianum BC1]
MKLKDKNKQLYNPTSNFIIFVVGTLITLLLAHIAPSTVNARSNLSDKILYAIFQSNLKFLYLIIGGWLEWIFIYSKYYPIINSKEIEIDNLTYDLNEAKNNMKTEAGLLLNRYSDLTKFKVKDILEDSMRRFIDGKDIIQSVQLYKYSFITNKDTTKIKVEYTGGYVKQDICINSIMQSYFIIPTYILNNLSIVLGLYNHLENDISDEEELLIMDIFNNIDNISKEIINDIKDKLKLKEEKTEDFDDYDADLYGVLTTTIKLLFNDDDENELIDEEDDYDKVRSIGKIFTQSSTEENLKSKKRLGILESILTKEYSIFQHDGDNDKNGRSYISKCISLNGEKFVLMLTADSSISLDIQWKNKLLELSNELEEVLKISFNEA